MRGYQLDDGSFAPLGPTAYRTGDIDSRDADGYFTYVGPLRRRVQSPRTTWISPFELESALIEHQSVGAEAAVVPAPDPVRTWRCRRPTSFWSPERRPTALPPCRSSATCESAYPPSSASAASSSPTSPKTIAAQDPSSGTAASKPRKSHAAAGTRPETGSTEKKIFGTRPLMSNSIVVVGRDPTTRPPTSDAARSRRMTPP